MPTCCVGAGNCGFQSEETADDGGSRWDATNEWDAQWDAEWNGDVEAQVLVSGSVKLGMLRGKSICIQSAPLFRGSLSMAELGNGFQRVLEGLIWDSGLGYCYCTRSSQSDDRVYTALVFNGAIGAIWAAHGEGTCRGGFPNHKRCRFERLLPPSLEVAKPIRAASLIHIVISSHTTVNFPLSPLNLLTIPFLITSIKFRKGDVECFPPF